MRSWPSQVIGNIQYGSAEGSADPRLLEGTAALHEVHWRRRADIIYVKLKQNQEPWKPSLVIIPINTFSHVCSKNNDSIPGASEEQADHTKLNIFFRHTDTDLIGLSLHHFSFSEATWLPSAWFVLQRGAAVPSSKHVFFFLKLTVPTVTKSVADLSRCVAFSPFSDQGKSYDRWRWRCWGEGLLMPRRRSRRRKRRYDDILRNWNVLRGLKITFSQLGVLWIWLIVSV